MLTDEQVLDLFMDCRQRLDDHLAKTADLRTEMRMIKQTMKSRGLEVPEEQTEPDPLESAVSG